MRAISYALALCAALFFLAAAAAWWRIYRDPRDDLTVGGVDSKRLKAAARLTAVTFGLSGIAAILAVSDWFLRQMLVD